MLFVTPATGVSGLMMVSAAYIGTIITDSKFEGVLVASETEEEIFKILGVPWQEPHERVRG